MTTKNKDFEMWLSGQVALGSSKKGKLRGMGGGGGGAGYEGAYQITGADGVDFVNYVFISRQSYKH